MNKFSNLKTSTKLLIVGCGVCLLAVIVLVVVVFATGGFNGI